MASPNKNTHRLSLVGGDANPQLAKDIATELELKLDPTTLTTFSNGEEYGVYEDSVRGADVFVIQTHASLKGWSINDSIMQQRLLLDAARRASAHEVIAVSPYLGYSRQDRKSRPREPISAAVTLKDLVTAGADRVMTVDMHSQQIQAVIDKPFDHLTAQGVLVDWLIKYIDSNRQSKEEVVIVSPDSGRAKLVEDFAEDVGVDWATVLKKRSKITRKPEAVGIMGDVVGRHCVILDDMIDTAGTLAAAAEMLKNERASSVMAMATHGILSGNAIENINNSPIELVVVTDTLPTDVHKENLEDKLEIASMAPKIAEAIREVHEDGSVSEVFKGKNAS